MNRFLTAACALAALAIPGAALAQHHSGGGHGGPHAGPHGGGPHGGFHSNFRGGGSHFAAGSISRFSTHQMSAWRGGHWRHGNFGGRFGWWWWAGGFWYFYDTPVYPYPGYVAEVYVTDPAAGGAWYYCEDPAGYYPYVQRCRGPWRQVAPTPQAGGPGPEGHYSDGAPPPEGAAEAPNDAPPPQDGPRDAQDDQSTGPQDSYQQPQQDEQSQDQPGQNGDQYNQRQDQDQQNDDQDDNRPR